MIDQLEQQTNSQIDKPKTWGGKREGAGRKHGAIQKISGRDILDAIERTLGIDFPTQIALNYQQVLYGDDARLKLEYDRMLLSKVVADKVDITTNGHSIAPPIINIQKQEIPDYIDVKPL